MLGKKDFYDGFAQSDWDAAKEEARVIMIRRARVLKYVPLLGVGKSNS